MQCFTYVYRNTNHFRKWQFLELGIVGFLLYAGLAFQFSSSPAFAERIPIEILAGVHRDFPPHYSVDEQTGKPTGFAIDTLEEIAGRVGVKVRYVIFNEWPEIIRALKEGRIDIIPNMGIIEERETDFYFTRPVEVFHIDIFVRETAGDIKGINDLQGRKVAVVSNNKGRFIVQEYGRARPVVFPSLDEALLSLLSGNTDALVYPEPPVLALARKTQLEKRIKTVGKPLLEVKRAIAVVKGKTELLNILDKGIHSFVVSPAYAKIYAKWYGTSEPYWNVRTVSILAGGSLLLIIVLFAAGHYFSLLRLNRNLQDALEEQKKAEDRVRQNEERHRTVLRTAMDGIWRADLQGRLLEVNDTYCRMSGYNMQELLAMRISDLDVAEGANQTAGHIRKVVAEGEDRFESRHRRKDGSIFDVEVSVQYRPDDGGQMVAFLRDVTKRKQAEEERAALEGQLLQAQKMESVGRLAGGVAHDFNNMLGVILGHAEIALDRMPLSDPLHADLAEIRDAAERSADLTRQLLAFARKQTVAPQVIDLNDTVTGMLKMLQRLMGENINLYWQPEAGLGPVKVDTSQIDQILANLCLNARDAIAGVGKMTIETGNVVCDENYCAAHAGAVPGEYVLLAVSDNGGGMDKETRAHLFEPFFTTKEMGKGTGLGLATVYGIVKQNNGFIDVYSEPDQGTTFKIYLPRYTGQEKPSRQEDKPEQFPRGRETILVVEDESSLLDLNKLMLETQGYRVLAAGTPGEALRLAEVYAGEIHLLMTDVVMPEMNGRDLANKMLPLYPGMKCLFTSGYTANVIAHHGVLDAGVHFIQKPFSRKDLAAKVRQVLEQK